MAYAFRPDLQRLYYPGFASHSGYRAGAPNRMALQWQGLDTRPADDVPNRVRDLIGSVAAFCPAIRLRFGCARKSTGRRCKVRRWPPATARCDHLEGDERLPRSEGRCDRRGLPRRAAHQESLGARGRQGRERGEDLLRVVDDRRRCAAAGLQKSSTCRRVIGSRRDGVSRPAC